MKFLKEITKLFKTENRVKNNPQDVAIEQKKSDNALVEIELRDR